MGYGTKRIGEPREAIVVANFRRVAVRAHRQRQLQFVGGTPFVLNVKAQTVVRDGLLFGVGKTPRNKITVCRREHAIVKVGHTIELYRAAGIGTGRKAADVISPEVGAKFDSVITSGP